MTCRNTSFVIPKCLLDQIEKRAAVKGIKRNVEMRYLLSTGLNIAAEADVDIRVPVEEPVRSIVWADEEILKVISDRSERFQRSVGKEIVRLVAFALQESTNRDLALLASMMTLSGQSAPSN